MFKKSVLLVALYSMQAAAFTSDYPYATTKSKEEIKNLQDDVRVAYRSGFIKQVAGIALGVVAVKVAFKQGYIDNSYWNYYVGCGVAGAGIFEVAQKLYTPKSETYKKMVSNARKTTATGLVSIAATTAAVHYAAQKGYIQKSFWKHFLAFTVVNSLVTTLGGKPSFFDEDYANAVAEETKNTVYRWIGNGSTNVTVNKEAEIVAENQAAHTN